MLLPLSVEGSLEGGSGSEEAANPIQGNHEEVHDQQGGLWGQSRQQGNGAGRVNAPQLEVLEAGLPHLLMRCHTVVAEDLQLTGSSRYNKFAPSRGMSLAQCAPNPTNAGGLAKHDCVTVSNHIGVLGE